MLHTARVVPAFRRIRSLKFRPEEAMNATECIQPIPQQAWMRQHWLALVVGAVVSAGILAGLCAAVRQARIAASRTSDR